MVERKRSMEPLGLSSAFWSGQRVLLTGNTGFKGAWLSLWLLSLGADVTGFSLEPDTDPNLFSLLRLSKAMRCQYGDVRSPDALSRVVADVKPTVVLHLAAQPLVRRGYAQPAATFETNVLGTVNLLESLRACDAVQAIVVVTTDKCYSNEPPADRPFRETDALGGCDPYSASKAAAELVCDAYRASYFKPLGVNVSTARAGNVIGGGDWAEDRIVPDLVRAAIAGKTADIRYPDAVRPWQHVLEPLYGYLLLAQNSDDPRMSGAWNFGPDPQEVVPVSRLADLFLRQFDSAAGWRAAPVTRPWREASTLALDTTKAQTELGWHSRLNAEQAIALTALWYRSYYEGDDACELCKVQLREYAA
jgi:CDP-glucose 4,6-dehydratase